MKNKIVKKYTLPRFALLGGYALIVISFVGLITNAIDKHQSEKTQHAQYQKIMFSVYGLAASALLAYHYYNTKHDAQKFVNNFVCEYIKNLTNSDTDFAKFQHLINNPQVLQYIGNFISNNLRVSEQKEIINLIEKTEQIVNPLKVEDAYKKIEQIIQNHIHVHPEFIPNIYSEFVRAEHLYYRQNQNSKQK